MGLAEYKKWKLRNQILEIFSEFGITEDDLRNFKKERDFSHEKVNVDEIKEMFKDKKTPEEVLKQFTEEGMEEFYADGRRGNN